MARDAGILLSRTDFIGRPLPPPPPPRPPAIYRVLEIGIKFLPKSSLSLSLSLSLSSTGGCRIESLQLTYRCIEAETKGGRKVHTQCRGTIVEFFIRGPFDRFRSPPPIRGRCSFLISFPRLLFSISIFLPLLLRVSQQSGKLDV